MTSKALKYYCPRCGALVVLPNETALALIQSAGACHKCRLAKTVQHLADTNQIELLADVLRLTSGYEGFRFSLEGLP
ncbi:MAG: hypothetical protein ABIH46_10760 [Chloroflexota bacterium]